MPNCLKRPPKLAFKLPSMPVLLSPGKRGMSFPSSLGIRFPFSSLSANSLIILSIKNFAELVFFSTVVAALPSFCLFLYKLFRIYALFNRPDKVSFVVQNLN